MLAPSIVFHCKYNMTHKEFKWANELHWMVKGHLIPQEWAKDEQQVK